eukprot:GILK01008985.1.p1 GENE.GILK01008985.1~~GILK01008985.1.p1  ORF type:complete len:461 (-),score=64.85 GILK01008985.1:205-1548(-)
MATSSSRVVLIIDGAYLFKCMQNKDPGLFDGDVEHWQHFISLLEKRASCSFKDVYYFGATRDAPTHRQKRFFTSLQCAQIKVVTGSLKTLDVKCPNTSCKHHRSPIHRLVQAGTDVAIATKMLTLVCDDEVDSVMLLAGDGDFLDALKYITEVKRKQVWVCGCRGSVSKFLQSYATRGCLFWLEDLLSPAREQPLHNGLVHTQTSLHQTPPVASAPAAAPVSINSYAAPSAVPASSDEYSTLAELCLSMGFSNTQVEEVIASQHGNINATIEALLAMSVDDTNSNRMPAPVRPSNTVAVSNPTTATSISTPVSTPQVVPVPPSPNRAGPTRPAAAAAANNNVTATVTSTSGQRDIYERLLSQGFSEEVINQILIAESEGELADSIDIDTHAVPREQVQEHVEAVREVEEDSNAAALVGMGFPLQDVRNALFASSNDFQQALEMLCRD